MEEEIWKPIPGLDGYEVSNLGQVRSYRVRNSNKLYDSPHLLKPSADKHGRKGVVIDKKHKRVARLVMLAFTGPPPEGLEVCHNDGSANNDRLDNLRYDTRQENIRDLIQHHGGIHPRRKFTVNKAPYICVRREDLIEAYKSLDTISEISKKLGLKPKTVMESASRLRRLGIEIPRLTEKK